MEVQRIASAAACQLQGVYRMRRTYTNESGSCVTSPSVPMLVRRMLRMLCGRHVVKVMLRYTTVSTIQAFQVGDHTICARGGGG